MYCVLINALVLVRPSFLYVVRCFQAPVTGALCSGSDSLFVCCFGCGRLQRPRPVVSEVFPHLWKTSPCPLEKFMLSVWCTGGTH